MTYSMRLARTNRLDRYSFRRGGRVARAATASVEALESRLMLTAVSWTGGTGNFNVAGNWSDNLVPNTNDDVTIGAGAVVSVTDNEDVATLTTTAGSTLNVASTGVLDFGTGNIAGTFTSSAGAALNLGPSLTLSGTTDLVGTFFGGQMVANSGALTLTGTELSNLNVTNTGSIIFDGGSTLQNSTTVTNAAGATFTLDDLTGINNANNRNSTVINLGTFTLNGGSGTADLVGIQLEDTGGTINVQSGTLSDEFNAYFQNATFDVAAGAAFAMDPISMTNTSNNFLFSGTNTAAGAGNVLFNSGQISTGDADGTQPPSSVLNFPAGFAQVTGSSFVVNPQDGPIQQVTNAGFLEYVGAAAHANLGLFNQGTIDVLGSGDVGVGSSGAFTNEPTGVLNFESDANVGALGGNTAFTNMGLIEKTAGTGESIIGAGVNGIGFANPGGSFNVQSGTLSLQNEGGALPYTAGAITVATGATFDLDNGGSDIYASGTFAPTGGGQVTFTSGTLVGPSAWGGRNGVPPTTPATLDFAPGTFSDVGGVFADDQTLINAGAITFIGANTLNGLLNQGTMLFPDTGPLNFSGAFINDTAGLINFENDTPINILGNNGFQNNGTIIKSGGAGTLDLSGISLTNAGTIEAASGTINLPDNGMLFGFNTAANVIVAGATFQVDAGAAITVQNSPAFTGNDGVVILNGAGASFPAIDSLNTNAGDFEVLSGAAFTTAGALTNTGTITVGGDLTVAGDFTESQAAASGMTTPPPPALDLVVDAAPGAATAPDFTVTGNTTLAGNLTASFASGFTAAAGSYTAANFATAATGSFASTSGVAPDFTATVNPTSIILNAGGSVRPTQTVAKIGGLDPNFGVDGIASNDVGFAATAGLVVQGDGKSVIAGTSGSADAGAFGITRYNADGTLDTSFGANGVTITTFPGDAQATAELLLSNGDILVAGTDTTLVNGQSTGSQFALAEYTSAGVLDPTFGNGAGYVLTSFSASPGTLSNDAAHALAVGPDGTIYLGGSSDAAGHGLDFAIAAYTSSGASSSSFGTNGQVLLDFMGGDDSIGALAFGLKGALIAAGSATDPSTGVASVALAEFLPTGALNTTFGAKGKLTMSVGGVDDAASALAIGVKGAIVVGGDSATGSASAGTLSSNFLLLRYDATGKLDKTFGNGGVVTTSFNQPAAITNLLVNPDGTIVASGKTVASLATLDLSELELAAARYTDKGRLDTSYNGTGQAIYTLSTAVTTASLTTTSGGKEQPAIATSTATPFDATSDLMSAFMQLTQSDQGVIAMTAGGDLLDAANNGANTVEAAIVAMGLDLAATLNVSLPASIIGGGKGAASVNIAEVGTELAAGTFTIELFASSTASPSAGETPFQTFPENLKLKEDMAKSLKFKFDYPSSLSSGSYYLVATVTTGSARDLDPVNNTSASASTVVIAPAFVQLSGNGLTAPTFDGAKPASVSFTITNVGNETASATAVQFFASTTATPTGSISLATSPVKLNLKPGAGHVFKVKLALPATLPAGTYMLVALLDPSNVFNDPNAAMNFIVSGNTFVAQ